MEKRRIVLLGDFDGVHIGHRALIEEGLKLKETLGYTLTAWTFDSVRAEAITDVKKRSELLVEYGADEVLLCDFSQVKDFDCGHFVKKVLRDTLNAAAVICGYNYSFGRGGVGSPSLLRELCAEEGISVTVVDEVRLGGEVSSSRIRELLRTGDVSEANKLLGRRYTLSGTVCHGAGLGRTVGVPTVNVGVKDGLLLPKRGVYATLCKIGGSTFSSVTNVGLRPTVNDGRGVSVEAHLLDFSADVYGMEAEVELVELIREERTFPSLEALTDQIENDKKQARKILATINC